MSSHTNLNTQLDDLQEQLKTQSLRAAHTDGQAYYKEIEKMEGLKTEIATLKIRLNADTQSRKKDLAKIHMAKKDLAMTDDSYRALIKRITKGRTNSSAELTTTERVVLLAEFKRLGWHPKRSRKHSPERTGLASKITATWIDMSKRGLLRDGSERALGHYCKRMTGKHSVDWLTIKEAQKLLESLKQWESRLEAEA